MTAKGEREFFVDIERYARSLTDWAGYHWQLRSGEMNNAAVISAYPEVKKSGTTVTLWGARRAARRAKRRVMRLDRNRYLDREAV